MAKNPNQLGANTVWDGPLSEVGRPLAKGNARNNMQVLKAPTPYSPGPITTKTYKSQISQGIFGLSSTK
tara:strand:- start:170 stop:376 length:207 start_codon:yes stop_codon:yes gene_type:complete